MPCFTEEAKQLIISDGGAERHESLKKSYENLIKARVDYIEYGKPDELSAQRRAKLNCDLLKQVLIYRAEQLMAASGTMLTEKNLYALALTVRGHIETLAVLGYFTRRLDSLVKGNIKFEQFEEDIANGLLGAKHDFFSDAKAPTNIVTCVEHTDKYLDSVLFAEKKEMVQDLYGWLSEFAHPNFCSNKSAFTIDRETGRMMLRKEGQISNDHHQMIATLRMSMDFLDWFLPQFTENQRAAFPNEA
jgi:hypothetical protein